MATIKTLKQQFNSRTGVKALYGEYVDATPRDVDWSDLDIGDVQAYAADVCDACGQIVVNSGGEEQHQHIEIDEDAINEDCEGYISEAWPAMNYAYPIDTGRVGGIVEAAKLLYDLPVCLVEWDGEEWLALTGGGMDLTWEICESYMRLGYLPPAHFADLPMYSGKTLTARNRWIVGGVRATLQLRAKRARWDIDKLNRVVDYMKEQKR